MKTIFTLLLTLIVSITIYGQTFPDSEIDGEYFEVNVAKLWTVSFGEGEPLFFIAGGFLYAYNPENFSRRPSGLRVQ